MKIKTPRDCSRDELLELLNDAAKNWLAHDGLWFQAVEKECGLDTAIKFDVSAWEKFSVIEAERIMKRLNIPPNGGIPALIQALNFRLYAYINKQEVVEVSDKRCVFRMVECRVQETRKRKNLPAFHCKPVGITEYTNFAKTIDPRIQTKCITCPPDIPQGNYWCAWEFAMK